VGGRDQVAVGSGMDTGVMLGEIGQLGLFEEPRVVLRWHRDVSPPDARGPLDRSFEATLDQDRRLTGWGRSERSAVRALAHALRVAAIERGRVDGFTGVAHALTAAALLQREALERWLTDLAGEPQLAPIRRVLEPRRSRRRD
jgi:hypothetical protein